MTDRHVTRIYIYPVKSAAGIEVAEAELDAFGLRLDRRWMVVDDAGRFLTQRQLPRMALIRVALEGGALRLTFPDAPILEVPVRAEEGAGAGVRRRVVVWGDAVEAVDTGETAARWLSAALGRPARLVHLPDDAVRPVDPRYARPGDRVAFADAFPVLLISEDSLEELNRRLAEPVPMNRFRPNLVVRAGEPHAEDGWRRIRIGEVEFDVVKPCARCAITLTDQATAERGKEPLRTLATYRTRNGKVLFGQNLIHRGRGAVRVGMAVEA